MKKASFFAILISLWPGAGLAQTTEELVNDGKNTENVTTQSMGYDRKSYSPLKQINKSNVKRLVPDLEHEPDERHGRAGGADDLQRRHVRRSTASGRSPSTSRPAGRSGARRWSSSRACSARDARSPGARATIYNGKLFRVTIDNHVARARHEDRQAGLEPEIRRLARRLLRHRRADRRQRRADFRHGRRRVHHARVPRRLGSRHRQEAVAPIHHSGARRAWFRDLAEEQRRLDAGRRADVALRFLRSAARSRLLGHRQCGAVRSAGRARVWTACTRPACSRSGRRPARSSVTSNTRPTTCTTWTAPTSTCSPISRSAASCAR